MARNKGYDRTQAEMFARNAQHEFTVQEMADTLHLPLPYTKNIVKRMLMCKEVVHAGHTDGPRGARTRRTYKATPSCATGNNG